MIMCEFIIGMIVALSCVVFGWCLGEADGQENARKKVHRKINSLYGREVIKDIEKGE